jgi:acetylornithine deacetylase/succinyl-diaminopimelate desuccinylase family protein
MKDEHVLQLTRKLIRIDSSNPPGREREIALFCRDYLRRAGIASRIVSFARGRDNIIAAMGSGPRCLLITPHLDTVPAGEGWSVPPFAGRVRGSRLYGLGATDCKCNLACALAAMARLSRKRVRLPYRLMFAATADEETGSALGLIPLLKKGMLDVDAALVLDADDFDIIVAQKGLMHLKTRFAGTRAHAAYPWLGINAIDRALAAVGAVKQAIAGTGRHAYLRPATVNTGTIRGGDKVNIVADWCEVEMDIRFLPGERGSDLLARVKRIIARSAACPVRFEAASVQEPYEISVRHPLVRVLRQAMKRAGMSGRCAGSEGATVITFFQHRGIPAVATGFGARGKAHVTDEFARIPDIGKGAHILEEFLTGFTFEGV